MVESLCPEVAAASVARLVLRAFPRLKRLIALGDRPGPGWWTWADAGSRRRGIARAARAAHRSCRPDDVYNIQFTSGTTGLPKGAMLTHRNVLMNAYYTGDRLRYSADDRVCVPVPFYHCFGCVLGTLVCAVYGSAHRRAGPVVRRRRHAGGDRCRALHVGLWRADHVRRAARTPRLRPLRPDEPAHRDHVGRPVPTAADGEGRQPMGIREICIGYGQTEASPIITFTSVDDPIEVRVGTVGHPIPGLEVKLVDPTTGRDVGRPTRPASCACGAIA